MNILLGRERCSCEQINNITGYFREDEQLPRAQFCASAHIFCDITCLPTVQARTHPIGPLQLDIHVMSCHSATFALQRGCFVPREWLAVKGLFCMVAHNCHSKTKNLTAKTKYLTAKPKTSRQKQNTSRQNQIHHSKSKRALVLLWVFAFAVIWLSKSCRFMIISISAYRFEVLNDV